MTLTGVLASGLVALTSPAEAVEAAEAEAESRSVRLQLGECEGLSASALESQLTLEMPPGAELVTRAGGDDGHRHVEVRVSCVDRRF